jgi:predicted transcriptional regulator
VGIGTLITYASVAIFVLGMVTFAVVYRRMLLQTIKEYEKAKVALRGLLLTLPKLKGGKKERGSWNVLEAEMMHVTKTQTMGRLQELEKKLVKLSTHLKTSSASDKELILRVREVQREVKNLTKTQELLQSQINTLHVKIQQTPRLDRNEILLQTEDLLLSRITETERNVLHMLMEEGAMTAPKVEKKIGKTREHTARLMKKLWKEGYVERDTHKMPFTYRPTKKLKEILNKKKQEKKTEEITSTITKKESRE